MGEGVLGFFIFFWIFEIGGMVIGRIFGLVDVNSVSSIAIMFVVLGVCYVAFYFIKRMGDRKRAQGKAERAAQNAARHPHKKKKKK